MKRPTRSELYDYYARKALVLDEIKATYEHPNWYKRTFYQARFRAVLEALSPKTGDRILDAGSGPGYYSRHIAERGAEVVSLDVSRNYLLNIPSSVQDRIVADAERLPLRDNVFDRVLATEVLEHTLEPEAMVEEIWRVLKPTGQAVITAPSSVSYMDRLYEVKARLLRYKFMEHMQVFTPESFAALLSRHFRIRRFQSVNCLVPFPLDMIAVKVPESVGRPIVEKLEGLLSGGPHASSVCWTMIAVAEPLQGETEDETVISA